MGIVSITHTSDIDGVASAALIKMRYGISSKRIFFANYSPESLTNVERSMNGLLGNEKGTVLFITDLGMNKPLGPSYIRIIDGVKRRRGRIIWLDHHMWTEEEVEKVASRCDLAIVGENKRYCATEITYRNIRVSGSFARKLVSLVHYSDFNKRAPDSKTRKLIGIYAVSIMYYNTLGFEKRQSMLRHMVDVLAGGKFTDRRIVRDAKAFEKLNNKRIKEMLKDLYDLGQNISLGFSVGVQSTQGCAEIMRKSRCETAIYVNTTQGTVHLRSKKRDTTILSKSFGGGGHPHASAFRVDVKKFRHFASEKERKAIVDIIRRRIEKLY